MATKTARRTSDNPVKISIHPDACLRCPQFPDPADDEEQRFWNGLWAARLEIFRRLFPWIGQAIKELAGLPPNAAIGDPENHQQNLALLSACREYEAGYRSDRKEVHAIHDRQNAEWTALTNLPPLGDYEDWRAAAAAAGFPPAEFDQANLGRVVACVLAWALARRAAMPAAAGKPAAVKGDGAMAAEPLEPTKAYLTTWGEILSTLKLKTSDKDKIAKLNTMHDGPILTGGRGEQPQVEKGELIAWHEGLAVRFQEIRRQKADRRATAVDGYEYGKDGAVAFGGSGSVKKRRRDRKP